MLTIAVLHTCGPRGTAVIMILASGRRTSTEIRYVKTLTIVVLVRLFAQRQDASENPMRAINVEEAVFESLRW